MAAEEVQLLREENAKQKLEFEVALEREHHAHQITEMEVHEARVGQKLVEVHATIQKIYMDGLCCWVKAPKKARKVNIHARLLTCLEAQQEWEEQQAVEDAHLVELKKKADEQNATTHAHMALCLQNAVLKTFDLPLHHYKSKDDLHNLALALTLNDGGHCLDNPGSHQGPPAEAPRNSEQPLLRCPLCQEVGGTGLLPGRICPFTAPLQG
ncbi:hypothetical protein K439DRAFT_1622272 [Ramaria rubella]|nr:hypothetical protein K439DRAFT_1622272 [Ramaria rubella]